MATREAFGQLFGRVCQERGWELLPGGVRVACGDGRHQLVTLEFFESESEELVRLSTVIGAARRLDANRLASALRMNYHLAHGAFALKDDELVMTDALRLEDAGPAEIEASLGYLAETADYYERTIFDTDEH
jgi:hypothetical protein